MKTYILKYNSKIVFLKNIRVVKAILIDNPQDVLTRIIIFNQ